MRLTSRLAFIVSTSTKERKTWKMILPEAQMNSTVIARISYQKLNKRCLFRRRVDKEMGIVWRFMARCRYYPLLCFVCLWFNQNANQCGVLFLTGTCQYTTHRLSASNCHKSRRDLILSRSAVSSQAWLTMLFLLYSIYHFWRSVISFNVFRYLMRECKN